MTESLAAAFPKEQERCRMLLKEYQEIGPAGRFAAIMIEASLKEAEEAAMSDDLVRMIRAYESLKGHE